MNTYITTEEAIKIYEDSNLGVISVVSIIKWVRNNKLGRKVGGRWKINKDKFIKYIGVDGDEYREIC